MARARRVLGVALVVGLALAAAPRPAAAQDPGDEGSTGGLVLAGVGMAVPTYVLGVAWHEGTHALWAKAFGAEITELRLWPGWVDGHFYFGYTRWRGKLSTGELRWTLIAPKVTDLVLFGTYAALLFTGTLPDDEYGQLAFAVVATGAWVDFSKDVVSINPTNDVIRFHALGGRTRERQRLPWRALHLGLSLAGAWVLYEGYARIFDGPAGAEPVRFVVPVFSGRL